MSISDDEGLQESVTEEYRALKYFTGRFGLTRHFSRYLHSEPTPEKILFLHGDGGNGKSLLLRYWFEKTCFRFADWNKADNVADDRTFANSLEGLGNLSNVPVIAAFHDFGQAGRGEQQPQDALYGPLMLRNALAESAQRLRLVEEVGFPRFDFSVAWYLHRHGKSSEEICRLLSIDNGDHPLSDFAPFIDSFLPLPVCSLLTSVDKLVRLNEQEITKLMRTIKVTGKLKREWVAENCQIDTDKDLVPRLSRYLAEDLNAVLQKLPHLRIALLFDTHEAFWGAQRDQGEALYFERDSWLRRFLRALNLDQGIIVVVSGRELPRWHEAGRERIDQEYLDAQLVGHFGEQEAREYLEKLEIVQSELQTAVLKYSSVVPGEIQPFMLALCADVALAARDKNEKLTPKDFPEQVSEANKPREMLQRLTKYANENLMLIINVLSVCRTFNLEIFQALGEHFRFQQDSATFKILCRFSFIWEDQNRNGWYRVHDLIRRLYDEDPSQEVRNAHQMMESYYRKKDKNYAVEAIFHANRTDWERGLKEWLSVFDEALNLSHYQLCTELLGIVSLLIVQGDFWQGRIFQEQGNYFATLSKHQEAQSIYELSMASFDLAIQLNPTSTAAHNHKGTVLGHIGDLQSSQSQYSDAQNNYLQSVESINRALELDSKNTAAYNNRGNVLGSLGDLQSSQSPYSDAQNSYVRSVESFDRALELDPKNTGFYNNKGIVLGSLGRLQSSQSLYSDAQDSYVRSVESFDRALELDPNFINVYNSKGTVLGNIGNLQSSQLQYSDAQDSYRQSVRSFDLALKLAPKYIRAHSNRGITLSSLGDLQLNQSQYAEAQYSYVLE